MRAAAAQTELFADRLALLEASLPRLSVTQSLMMQALERQAAGAAPEDAPAPELQAEAGLDPGLGPDPELDPELNPEPELQRRPTPGGARGRGGAGPAGGVPRPAADRLAAPEVTPA